MQPSKRSNRQPIAQQTAEHSIALVFAGPQPIAMFDAHAPTGDVADPRPKTIVDAGVVAQDLAAPAIVIAGDHQHGHAGVVQIRERGQRTKALSRDHRTPLEPELEQISIHDEGTRTPMQMSQELQQLPLYCGLRETEVQVGDDIRWCGEHALILAYQLAVHKLRQVPNEVLSW